MFWGVFEEIFSDARRPGTGGARMKEKPSERWRNGRMAEWMDGGFRKSFSDEIFSVQWFKVTSSSSAAAAATTTTKSDFVIWNSGAQESNSRTKFNLETFSTGSGSKLDVRLIINRTTFAQLHTDIHSLRSTAPVPFPGKKDAQMGLFIGGPLCGLGPLEGCRPDHFRGRLESSPLFTSCCTTKRFFWIEQVNKDLLPLYLRK